MHQRIDDRAGAMGSREVFQHHLSRLTVDLDFGNLHDQRGFRAVIEIFVRTLAANRTTETCNDSGVRDLLCQLRLRIAPAPVNESSSAGTPSSRARALQQFRFDLHRRSMGRITEDPRRPAGADAGIRGDGTGIENLESNAVHRHLQLVGDNLAHRRVGAGPLIDHRGRNRDFTIRINRYERMPFAP